MRREWLKVDEGSRCEKSSTRNKTALCEFFCWSRSRPGRGARVAPRHLSPLWSLCCPGPCARLATAR
eukprot:scaffold76295_cov28-Tisochrysis_lutea.AAC.3